MVRKRESLFTPEEAAFELGITAEELLDLELCFLTRLQLDYLNLLQYNIGYYPMRRTVIKRKDGSTTVKVLTPEEREQRKLARKLRKSKREEWKAKKSTSEKKLLYL